MSETLPRILTLTWTIPEHIGGMTRAALDRSAMLGESGYACETVLFAPTQHRSADRRRLEAAGMLPAAGRIVNLWDILSAAPSPEPSRGIGAHDPGLSEDAEAWEEDGVVRVRTRYAEDGAAVAQLDHFREDGSLLAIDRRDAPAAGGGTRRRITLFDRSGQPVRVWRSIWTLYAFALDAHLAGDRAVLFYDSKVTSKFAPHYRRDTVATVHVLHNRHLSKDESRPYGVLAPSRAEILHDLEAFDRVVCSTTAQRDDLRALLAHDDSLVRVIPPAIPESPEGAAERRAGHGVVLSSLEPRKRIEHLLEAVAIARERHPDLTLDIYGTGPSEAVLRDRIVELGIEDAVALRGYSPDAKSAFRTASWTALTSTHEGFGMAVAEAMASGCVPFAYDIAYGPAEMLTAIDGSLVAVPDPAALADRLSAFLDGDTATQEVLRVRVREESQRFRPERLVPMWRELVEECGERSVAADTARRAPAMLALRARVVHAGIEIDAEFGLGRKRALPRVVLGVAATDPAIEWRGEASVRRLAGTRCRATVLLRTSDFPAAVAYARDAPVDLIAVVGEDGAARTVAAAEQRLGPKYRAAFGVRGAARWSSALVRRVRRVLRPGG